MQEMTQLQKEELFLWIEQYYAFTGLSKQQLEIYFKKAYRNAICKKNTVEDCILSVKSYFERVIFPACGREITQKNNLRIIEQYIKQYEPLCQNHEQAIRCFKRGVTFFALAKIVVNDFFSSQLFKNSDLFQNMFKQVLEPYLPEVRFDELNFLTGEKIQIILLSSYCKTYHIPYKNITFEDPKIQLIFEAQLGNQDAMEKLINENNNLIRFSIKRFIGNGLEVEDLMQEGRIGLIQAINTFHCHGPQTFSTYAVSCIKNAVQYQIWKSCPTLSALPAATYQKLREYYKVQQQLIEQYGRYPTINEIAQAMHLSNESLSQIMLLAQNRISLNTPIGDGENTLLDLIPNNDGEIFDDETDMKEQIHQLLMNLKLTLTPDNYHILLAKMGFQGIPQTNKDIAKSYHLKPEVIRQRLERTLSQIRRSSESKQLAIYLADPEMGHYRRTIFNLYCYYNPTNIKSIEKIITGFEQFLQENPNIEGKSLEECVSDFVMIEQKRLFLKKYQSKNNNNTI